MSKLCPTCKRLKPLTDKPEVKTVVIRFRATEAHKKEIEKNARKAGQNVSEYITKRALRG